MENMSENYKLTTMEELSIEQKAKAYDEALKVLHKYDGTNIMFSQGLKEEMFPELRESEDERIKKEITELVMLPTWKTEKEFHRRKELVAWLEKQGEKKKDVRYESLEELLIADNIYQMAMNDEMVQEAKEKAINAIYEMCIGRLLGVDKTR